MSKAEKPTESFAPAIMEEVEKLRLAMIEGYLGMHNQPKAEAMVDQLFKPLKMLLTRAVEGFK